MLKDSEIPRYANRRTHRVYTPEFKASLVAACQKPGASIAALANANAMNANVLHRWLQENARTGAHNHNTGNTCSTVGSRKGTAKPGTQALATQLPAFMALPLRPAASERTSPAAAQASTIRVEIQRANTTIIVNWPVQDGESYAQWLRECLQ